MSESLNHALIIEDEMLVGLDMQAALSPLGFSSFAFASTAAQAVEQARLRRPDLVTADLRLLDGHGEGACDALEAEFGQLSIVYVTGFAGEAEGVGRPVVVKPFSPRDIAAAVSALRPLRAA